MNVNRNLLALSLVAATCAMGQHNTLTQGETDAGYQQLFNGTNLTGWRGWNSLTPPSSWAAVTESTWTVIRNGSGSAIPLVTNDSSYQNFDLKIEYNVPSAGNSGIFIRYNQYNRRDWGGASGPEAQIAASNNSDGSSTLHRMGTCYDMFGLQSSATNWDRPNGTLNYGRYHQFRIIAFNNRIAHYGNGIKLVEYDMTSTAYNTAYQASKYNVEPIYRTIHPGGIYLQHHGETNVAFRDIRIKKLTTSPWAQNSVYLKSPLDSAGGLKDSLTFIDNLFPTSLLPGQNGTGGNLMKARVLRNNGGVSLILEQRGDYALRVDDLNGKTVFKSSIRNDAHVSIPASVFSGTTRVVNLYTTSGSLAFRRIVAPSL